MLEYPRGPGGTYHRQETYSSVPEVDKAYHPLHSCVVVKLININSIIIEKMQKVIFNGKDNIFEYISSFFEGIEIQFRKNIFTGEIDIMLDDNFAKANGSDNLRKFFDDRLGYNIGDTLFNRLASELKWLRVERDGIHPIVGDGIQIVGFNSILGEA